MLPYLLLLVSCQKIIMKTKILILFADGDVILCNRGILLEISLGLADRNVPYLGQF